MNRNKNCGTFSCLWAKQQNKQQHQNKTDIKLYLRKKINKLSIIFQWLNYKIYPLKNY